MIIIAGTISIPPDRRAACLEASTPLQAATRNDEPGCIDYVFTADPVRDDIIAVYERWTDAASLEAHFLHENYLNMRNMFGKLGITGADVAKYRIDAHGPVYNSKMIASASFDE